MKICKQCLIEKDLESFRISKKYHLNTCRQCCREASMEPKEKDKKAAYDAAYYETNKEPIAVKKVAYQKDNKDRIAAYGVAYREINRAALNAAKAKRKAAKLNRTPKWTTETDLWMIKEIYDLAVLRTKLTGVKCQVDHIIPLQGELVSGLHVPSNLQVITATENKIKGNKFEVSV